LVARVSIGRFVLDCADFPPLTNIRVLTG